MAAFPILLAAYHGHLYQSNFKYPFPLICSIIAIAFGYLLNTDKTHVDILLVAAPMALGTNILLGYYAGLDFNKRKEQIALREAVDAQILEDRTRTLARISETLNELRGYNHDAGNALSGLMVMIPQFVDIVKNKTLTGENLAEAAEIASSLEKSLSFLQTILSDSREAAVKNGPQAVLVAPAEVIGEVCADIKQQFPQSNISCNIPHELGAVSVPFFGGRISLRRVVENVFINACQGNGTEKSTVVEAEVSLNMAQGEIMIAISDNGPGFTAAQLSTPITGFQTTKKSGTGLGLYTSVRVLKANGGRLQRANKSGGKGACVSITLKLESAFV
jgi:K+-sensing histidine kinase KdpD